MSSSVCQRLLDAVTVLLWNVQRLHGILRSHVQILHQVSDGCNPFFLTALPNSFLNSLLHAFLESLLDSLLDSFLDSLLNRALAQIAHLVHLRFQCLCHWHVKFVL